MSERLETVIEGLALIELQAHGDERGFLVETYRADVWRELGIVVEAFVQDNQSRSPHGTLRGLHFQTRPGQAKLVRCARGEVFDVAVDLRRESPTYGRWEGHLLSDRNQRQLFIPVGFAHGFLVTSEEADVAYKLSSYYDPQTEAGILWDDPAIGIEWPLPGGEAPRLSERDRSAPRLDEIAGELPW